MCLNLSFARMEALKAICNPGWAHNNAAFTWLDGAGEEHPFSLEDWLGQLLSPLGLCKFFDGGSSFVLDAYAYIFTLVPSGFRIWSPCGRSPSTSTR